MNGNKQGESQKTREGMSVLNEETGKKIFIPLENQSELTEIKIALQNIGKAINELREQEKSDLEVIQQLRDIKDRGISLK
jgi:hypothetical protein